MRFHQAVPQIAVVVHRVPILARLPVAQRVTILPKHVSTSTGCVERSGLPTELDRAIVVVAELLEHARLVQRRAHLSMVLDPRITPSLRGRDRPGVGVQVVRAEVDGGHSAVCCEIRALGESIRVGTIAWQAESFLARRDHVLRVQTFDVRGRCGDPVRELGGRAAIAAGLIGEFPGEDRGGGGVAGYDGFDVGLVLGLGFDGVVPLGVGGDAGVSEVCRDAPVVGPIVCEVLARR